MSETEHTLGPWRASFGTLIRVFAHPGHIVVCGVHKIGRQIGEYDRKAQSEVEANAHLIAAAPDMLAALQVAEVYVRTALAAAQQIAPNDKIVQSATQQHTQICRAIAKAEGRS